MLTFDKRIRSKFKNQRKLHVNINHFLLRLTLMMLVISIFAVGFAGKTEAAIIGTSGTVIQEINPFPPAADDQIYVFDEQQSIPFVNTQSLDFGIISPGVLVNSHYIQYDAESTTGFVRSGSITFDGPIIGVITTTANLYADLSPEVSGTSDSYFGLEVLLGPYPAGANPNGRGIGSPEDVLIFTLGENILIIDSLEIPVAGNLDGIRVLTTPIPVPATMLLLASSLVGLAGLRRKFWKR